MKFQFAGSMHHNSKPVEIGGDAFAPKINFVNQVRMKQKWTTVVTNSINYEN